MNVKNQISLMVFCILFMFHGTVRHVQSQTNQASNDVETKMIAVLRSDANQSEKAIACKLLAVHGSPNSVPDLAKLLANPQLASWSRIALEAIPGSQADQALLKAMGELEGNLLVGVINSIGVRRMGSARPALEKLLENPNREVGAAAAVALGHLGDIKAFASLSNALKSPSKKIRSAAAEACILLAESSDEKGNPTKAIEIYDLVRTSELPKQRRIEATRGAILARNEKGVPLLIQQLRSSDQAFFQLGLTLIREYDGKEINQPISDELPKAMADRAALIIQAVSDRDDAFFVSTILKGLESQVKTVQLSAIDALSRRGDERCIDPLLKIGLGSDAELAAAAKNTLGIVRGKTIDEGILKRLDNKKSDSFGLLIELVGKRRLRAPQILIATLKNEDPIIRHAAIVALGETVIQSELGILIDLTTKDPQPDDTDVARKALRAASVRMPDRDACATQLSHALGRSPTEIKVSLLEIISEVGGPIALKTIGRAANSKDESLQDAGSRLLGKWNSLAAAPVLLELAKTSPERKYQIRALRGYLGLARKFDMPNKERASMCRRAMEAASRPEEMKLALNVIQIRPSQEGYQVAVDAMEREAIRAEALQAALAISQKLGGNKVDLSKLIADANFKKVKLEIVKAEYGAGSKIRDVTEIVKKHAGDFPLVMLPSKQFNTCFGGDPAPGVVKQLKIRYRMNGKIGSATFSENSPIILSMPKR